MRRIFLAAIAIVALGAPVLLLGPAVPASAATPPSCGKLTGSITSSIKVSNCTPTNSQYKTATAPASALATGKGTVTWSPSKKTTSITISVTQSGTSCAAGSTEYKASGKVTGGTATYTAKGQTVSADVCVSPTGSLSLVAKTRMKF